MKNFRLAPILLLALIFCSATSGAAEINLPELRNPSAWVVENPDRKILETGEISDWLSVNVNVKKDSSFRLMLKNPVDIPEGGELVWNGIIKDIKELTIHVLATDSKGVLFQFNQESHSFCRDSMFLGGRFDGGLLRVGEVRFRTKGLRAFAKQSYKSVSQPNRHPVPPMKLAGLEFGSEDEKPQITTVYFRNFRLTDVTHRSSLYYQFNNQECFGEIDGKPSLSYGDILGWLGYKAKQFQIDWDVRRQYDGQPFMSGTASFEVDPKSAIPVALQLAKRIEFPVTKPGTYWVSVKIRANSGKPPLAVKEDEYRLYVINGEDKNLPSEISADQRIGSSSIRISPERQSTVWTEKEPWILKVRFFDAEGTIGKVEVKDNTGTVLMQKEEPSLSGDQELSLDLSSLGSGIFQAAATQLKDGKLLDQSILPIGRKESLQEGSFALPAGVLTARQVIDGPKPLFYFDAHIGNRGPDDVDKIKKVMDATAPITKNFELRAFWDEIEILPGVYDFSRLDALLQYAGKQGTAIQLFISFSAPEWVPSHYTQNPDGEIFGHNSYLFHGARLNMFQSPVIRNAAVRFVENMVSHFRGSPALQSYYILIEHPGEAPFKSWYEGFDPITLGNFRTAMEKKYKTVQEADKAWKTQFKDFAGAMPPTYGTKAANRFWLDWISFREETVDDFKLECLREIRRLDPYRMIMLYGSGSSKFAPYNAMSANGGCERPDAFAEGMIESVDSGMPQRAEEVTVTNWAADYPTRLDTSLFSMMLGGGANSFCKMFFPVDIFIRNNSLEPLRKDPTALDRFEKFIPIWTELRSSRPIAGDVRYFTSDDNDRLLRKSTYSGGGNSWFIRFFLDSQVPFWVAPEKDWKKSKLLVLSQNRMSYLDKNTRKELLDYVKEGGNILMGAESGRYSIEDDDADWVLLKEFGFNPPGNFRENIYSKVLAKPEIGADDNSCIGTVRHLWAAGDQPGKILAVLKDYQGNPAITMNDYGKGRVFVLWTREVQPPGGYEEKAYPMLRAIAKICGADLPVECDSRYFWTNLMKDSSSDTWYLLVMRNTSGQDSSRTSTVKISVPEGSYDITELINGKTDLQQTASQLAEKGLVVDLGKREVAIFKIKRK